MGGLELFLIGLLLFGLGVVMGLMVARDLDGRDVHDPLPPTSEPMSHVRPTPVAPSGRVLKIGEDCHARGCVDDEGRVLCVCGYADREAAMRGEVTA